MKSSSPKELAIYIALLITIFCGGLILLLNIFSTDQYWLPVILGLSVFFIITFLITYYILSGFILEKIQPIYKTIHDFNLTQKEMRRQIDRQDFIANINQEVEDWADLKAKEIRKLKQLEKYRKEFVGNVSHELKTPIFNIQGYILTLLDGGLEDPAINRLYLERTEKSINRMISIVEDLESISRLESGELKLRLETFDIVKLVEESFEMLDFRAKAKNIKLIFGNNYNKAVKVIADRKRMQEVINNLVVNSVNYGKKNGKTTVSIMDMGENVLVDVTDNGIGISEEDIPRIFERFYRTDKSRSRDAGGTGLGLSIVKHIVEAHNQTISVKSKLDKGSSFIFTMAKG
jgi:two-component system phosphate regulon sensor histidine kinase PhoR